MEEVFKDCKSLKSINLSHFDTSRTTTMKGMFYNCSSLVFLDLSNFNTTIVANMEYMFKNCKKLKYINMKKFEQLKLTGYTDILLNTPENMIFCMNETKNSKIFNEIKKKTNYTINCSDDLIYLFLKEAFVDIGIITNSISNSILLTTIPETASETIIISTNYISYMPTLISTLIPTFIPTLETKTTYLKQTNPISTSIIQSMNIENLNDNEEIYNLIIDNILQMFSRENSLNRIIPGKDFIFFELTDSKNQLNLLKNKSYNNNNLSIIDLGPCEDVLREKYHIDEKDPLIILKQENISSTKSSDKNLQYEVFEPYNKTKLNLSVCKGVTINIHSKIELSENTKKRFEQLKSLGYNMFDINDRFYQDICTPYKTEDNTDILLSDRIDYIYNNEDTQCQSNCQFSEYSVESQYMSCTCKIDEPMPNNKNDKFSAKKIYESFYDVLKNSNYQVYICYNLVFIKNVFIKNIGGTIIFSFFLVDLGCFIYFIIKKDKLLTNLNKDNIENTKKENIIIEKEIKLTKNNEKNNFPPKKKKKKKDYHYV